MRGRCPEFRRPQVTLAGPGSGPDVEGHIECTRHGASVSGEEGEPMEGMEAMLEGAGRCKAKRHNRCGLCLFAWLKG